MGVDYRITKDAVRSLNICPVLTDFSSEFMRAMTDESRKGLNWRNDPGNHIFSDRTYAYINC